MPKTLFWLHIWMIAASFIIACAIMNALTIKYMLLIGGVESNPGPAQPNVKGACLEKSILTIRTYNCNGLGKLDKFRRLLIKCRDEVKKGGVVLLQETHVIDTHLISTYWKLIVWPKYVYW